MTTEKFKVFLTRYTYPTIINDDNEIEYVYALQDRENNQIANTYTIAENENKSSQIFLVEQKKEHKKCWIFVEQKGETRSYVVSIMDLIIQRQVSLTEFYKLPMQTLSVNYITTSTQTIKYLSNLISSY